MNLKKIVIYHHDVLFNILDEIKEKLNFNLEKVDKENFEELKKYNKLIIVNKNIKHEKLYRSDDKYDFLIPISYNTQKRILGKGSAIFIHLTKDFSKTLGCIALTKKDFLILSKVINKKTKIRIF